ncbi:MAG TPA: FHA domain-containing protein [Mycobacteriales bacterium]|nr:FHA domain-containing protein [Mycobacteriales bacterium]
MTAPIVIQVLRAGFLILLWLFVFAALRVIRSDLFGSGQPRVAGVPPRSRPARPPSRPKRRGRTPRVLVVTSGSLAGTRISLGEQPVMIGRANDSTLVLTDDYASLHHARLTQREGEWYVEDLGSTNGTYLDRNKVAGPTPIPPGMPIRIGKTVIELHS